MRRSAPGPAPGSAARPVPQIGSQPRPRYRRVAETCRRTPPTTVAARRAIDSPSTRVVSAIALLREPGVEEQLDRAAGVDVGVGEHGIVRPGLREAEQPSRAEQHARRHRFSARSQRLCSDRRARARPAAARAGPRRRPPSARRGRRRRRRALEQLLASRAIVALEPVKQPCLLEVHARTSSRKPGPCRAAGGRAFRTSASIDSALVGLSIRLHVPPLVVPPRPAGRT